MKNSNYILVELRRKGSVAPKSGERGGIQCKGWEKLAVHVSGLEEGGWGGYRSRTLQGGDLKWGELSVLILPYMKFPLLLGILMRTT